MKSMIGWRILLAAFASFVLVAFANASRAAQHQNAPFYADQAHFQTQQWRIEIGTFLHRHQELKLQDFVDSAGNLAKNRAHEVKEEFKTEIPLQDPWGRRWKILVYDHTPTGSLLDDLYTVYSVGANGIDEKGKGDDITTSGWDEQFYKRKGPDFSDIAPFLGASLIFALLGAVLIIQKRPRFAILAFLLSAIAAILIIPLFFEART